MQDASSRKKAKGLELLKQVYGELYFQLGEDYSAEELLRAAQTLIDISKDEYGPVDLSENRINAGYFSRDVDTMINLNSWLILSRESKLNDICSNWE